MTGKQVSFSWDIIYKCNYRCSYCWWHRKWGDLSLNNRYLPVSELIGAWARIYDIYGQASIDILGGEPFLYPDFTEIIRELSAMHRVNINTNLSCSVEDLLSKCDPSRIKINPTFHPMFARFEEFLGKAKALKEAGFTRGITYLAYPPQLRQLDPYRMAFKKEGIGFAVLSFWGEYKGQDYPAAYTEEEKQIINPQLAQRGGENFQTRPISSPRGKLCYAGCLYACIHPDGAATRCGGCCSREVLGNFFQSDFKLLEGPLPCQSDSCPCNEWASFLEENIIKREGLENCGV